MMAVYKGLEELYSSEESEALRKQVWRDSQKILKETGKDTNSVDRIMETLRSQGKAGEKVTIKYQRRTKAFIPSLETTVLGMIKLEYLGWYFFGLSVSGGTHSVILAVDNSQGGAPQIYWMDQRRDTRGFTKNVTGKLDKELKEEAYLYRDHRVWPLIAPPETVIGVP